MPVLRRSHERGRLLQLHQVRHTDPLQRLARVSGYRLEDTPFASGFAGYKDWFLQDFRRPGYTIEAGLGTNPLPLSQFDEIYRRNIGILVHALP